MGCWLSINRKAIQFLFCIVPSLFITFGCTGKNSGTPSSNIGLNQEVTPTKLKINVNETMSQMTENIFRPGVVAYGLLDSDKSSDFYGLKQFTSATNGRGGYVKIDELSNLLRTINTATELTGKLNEADEAVSLAISGGSKVELIIACSLPNSLSKLEGYNHNVIDGMNRANGQPIYSCSAIKNDPTARDAWFAIMKKTAEFFSVYGDNVVFIIGNEPETYFAGNSAELFDLFELTADGLRAGNAGVKIGGLNPSSYNLSALGHASPVYNAGSDSFSFSKEELGSPLLKLWLEYLNKQNLRIDIIQTKKFGANPIPSSSGFWIKEHAEIEAWLQATPNSYNENVELIYSDFPGWHTACAEDADGNRESIWDSEYFSSWFVSTYLAMKSFKPENNGIINNIEPLLGFLIEYGSDAFFHTSCEPDKSRPAGFGGAIGLITNKSKLPKPILHSLSLLTNFSGSLVNVSNNNDSNIQTVAAFDQHNAEASILISHFVPSELNYNTAGYVGYDWGTLFKNNYGIDFSFSDLKDLPVNQKLQNYLSDPNFPSAFVHDLLAGPASLDLNALGLPTNFVDFFAEARVAGIKNREIKEQSSKGLEKEIHIDFIGLPSGRYTLLHQVIDKNHGNAYTNRLSIQSELESAFSRGGESAALAYLNELRFEYGIESTYLVEKKYEVTGTATISVSLDANSVHLLKLKKDE